MNGEQSGPELTAWDWDYLDSIFAEMPGYEPPPSMIAPTDILLKLLAMAKRTQAAEAERDGLRRRVDRWEPKPDVAGTWSIPVPKIRANGMSCTCAIENGPDTIANYLLCPVHKPNCCICAVYKHSQYTVTILDPACPVHGENK